MFVICVKLFSDILNYWLVVLTIVKTFESFVHSFVHIFVHIVLIKLLVIRMKLTKSCNLFRTITKCSDHCVNCFENSDLSLEKCGKSVEKNYKSSKVDTKHYKSSPYHL